MMSFWWLSVFAAMIAWSTAGIVRRLALRMGIVDIPDGGRKKHHTPTALLGGLAVYVGFAGVTFLLLYATPVLTAGDLHAAQIVGLLIAGLVLVCGGVLDDVYPQRPWVTILFPIIACTIAITAGLGFTKITNPFGTFLVIPSVLSMFLTFVWLMAMTYTTKLLDGVDGLVSSVSFVGAGMIAALAFTTRFYQPDVALLACVCMGAIAGFLWWNFPPARMYLGEGGSTFLGFTLGALAVIGGSKTMTLLLVLGLPALDMLFVTVHRLIAGHPLFQADRRHLHLRLIDAGWPVRGVIGLYVSVGVIFGVTTLIFQSWEKVIALGILFIGAAGVMVLSLPDK